jgi:hypothetical protein
VTPRLPTEPAGDHPIIDVAPPILRGEPTPPPKTTQSRVPIHPWAALLLVVVDNLWNLTDWNAIAWIITVPLSFLSVCIPTLILQRRVAGDRWSRALIKALLLGVVAAVPTSITGTPIGAALLAWAGIERARR